ncbi:hypothetical protein ONE63_009015 [Megalurothrips usitatus]|uniref:Uncharacterized protein n=1 Tax=Megalurothrips usitatus TaxID=439358 RepID=A0AAV7XLR1_9NEOP|nr:hypothetical protein ONE63_009015 [Megalurothrips usitatus]
MAHQLALGGEWGPFRGGLPGPAPQGLPQVLPQGLHHFPHVLALPQHAQDGQGSENGDRPGADSMTPVPLPPHPVHPLHPLQHHIHSGGNNNNNPGLNNNNNNNNTIDAKDGSGKDSPVRGRSPTPSPPPSSASSPPLSLHRNAPPQQPQPRFRASRTPPPARDGSPSTAAPGSPPEHAAVPAGPFSPPAPQPFSGLHPALLQQHNSAFLSLFMNSPLPGAPWLYSQLYQPPHFQNADLHSMALQLQQRHAAAVGSLGSLTDSKMSSGASDEDGEVNVHDDDKDDDDEEERRVRRRLDDDDDDEDDVDVAAPCSPRSPRSPRPRRRRQTMSPDRGSSPELSRSPPSHAVHAVHAVHRLKAASPVTALRASTRPSPSKVVWRPY